MPSPPSRAGCALCRDAEPLPFDFSYAFQPIVDIQARKVFAHEALARGPAGEPADTVLSRVTPENRYSFDQACREKAIRIAAGLQLPSCLSINFLPNAIYRPEVCIRSTLQAAERYGFPVERIIFETVEGEQVSDGKWLAEILSEKTLVNGIVVSPNNECVRLHGTGTAATRATLTARSVLMQCNATKYIGSGSGATAYTAADVAAIFSGNNNNDAYTASLSAVFINGAAETAATAIDAKTLDSFFDTTTYVGAVKDANDTWYAGWTCGIPGQPAC